MFKITLIGIAVVIALFVVAVAMRPSKFRIVRSATIAAPPETLFEQVNDFRKWRGWSPWEKKDPALKRSYEGPSAGPGAVYSWVGNKDVGEGRMTLTDSQPDQFVRIKLEFLKPFAATHTAEFSFEPRGDATLVTWAMAGENNFICKAFCLFMDMDKMVGRDFEAGLAAMKTVAASSAAPAHVSAR